MHPQDLPAGARTYGTRFRELVEQHPDDVAIVFAADDGTERDWTWRELDASVNRVARLLEAHGVGQDDWVAVGLPNTVEHVIACQASWRLGAGVISLRAQLPAPERDALLEIGKPKAVVADWADVDAIRNPVEAAAAHSDAALEDRVAMPFRAIASGGSTGRPKLIVSKAPSAGVKGASLAAFGAGDVKVHLVPTPMYHTNGFGLVHGGLFEDQRIVLMERFRPARALDLIERHRVEFVIFVPTMLHRMLQEPGVEKRDFSSIRSILHGGSHCPAWVKRKWIDILGPTRLYEGIGATEGIGIVLVRGDEWLERPGTIGKPDGVLVKILDPDGNELPPGEVGEIFMRPAAATQVPFQYLGDAEERVADDNFASVGDLGWLDEDGYLYIADRRTDLIITGGANVYPAEVEAALTEHAKVGDAAVIGIPDEQWGRRVHAILTAKDPQDPPTQDELQQHCRERLAAYKVPKTYEVVDELPIDEQAGKIRRSALLAERSDVP